MNDKELECCTSSCDKPIDASYWEAQYKAKKTGWDLGKVSPPIKEYIDTLANKNARILIPGCGNSYEAEYLIEKGFTNITVIDIAPTLVAVLQEKFKKNSEIQVIFGDFFEHQGEYDLIIEQTFFCALSPNMRQKYVWKMHQLLAKDGILAGLLFNRFFESGPPFGGSQNEYELLIKDAFESLKMETALNSIEPRANSELFFELQKNSKVVVHLYDFEGITCSGCKDKVTEKLISIEGVIHVSMSTNYTDVLLVSSNEIAIEVLQQNISFDAKYSIKKTTL